MTHYYRSVAALLISTLFYQDTFYNDTRHYSALDYSKPVLDWLNDSSDEVGEKWDAISSGALKKRQKDLLKGLNISNVPELKSAKMESTYFSDLHFRLGAWYLYCHQVQILFSLHLPSVPSFLRKTNLVSSLQFSHFSCMYKQLSVNQYKCHDSQYFFCQEKKV